MPSFINIESVQKETKDLKLNNVLIFDRQHVHIDVSRPAALKLALLPAIRFDCNEDWPNMNI